MPQTLAPQKAAPAAAPKPEPEILFQRYFKSVGPRTYAAQIKKASNGNHFIVLTEGKRDDKSDQVRKTKLFVFSEDFVAFFKMLHETAQFIRENPVPEEVRQRRERFWTKQRNGEQKSAVPMAQRPKTDPASPSRALKARQPR